MRTETNPQIRRGCQRVFSSRILYTRKGAGLSDIVRRVARIRYPRLVTRFKRKKPPSLRDRLHKFAGVISSLGLAVAALTFLAKDVLRDRAKDLADSLEAARHVWLLKSSLDNIDDTLSQVEELLVEKLVTPSKAPEFPTNAEWDRFLANEDAILSRLLANFQLLYEKLPKGQRKKVESSEKSARRSYLNLHEEFQVRNEHVLQIISLKPPPPGTNRREYLMDVSSEYDDAIKHADAAFSDLVSVFESETASAARHVRTITYWTYVLYPLGILIGVLGQLAGVKPAGGE